MLYRKAGAGDCRAVYGLICDLEHRELPYRRFSAIYQRQLADSRYYCLVGECGRKVIAVLNMRFEEQLHHAERIAEILEFSISEDFRGRGIGREMFAACCRIASAEGCSQIELASNQLREGAHRFYRREGMHNFHFKFSKRLTGEDSPENSLGR